MVSRKGIINRLITATLFLAAGSFNLAYADDDNAKTLAESYVTAMAHGESYRACMDFLANDDIDLIHEKKITKSEQARFDELMKQSPEAFKKAIKSKEKVPRAKPLSPEHKRKEACLFFEETINKSLRLVLGESFNKKELQKNKVKLYGEITHGDHLYFIAHIYQSDTNQDYIRQLVKLSKINGKWQARLNTKVKLQFYF